MASQVPAKTLKRNKSTDAAGPGATSFHFVIPLKQQNKPVPLPDNFAHIIGEEYAVRYLESIGVRPTKQSINLVLQKVPLKDCTVSAGWKSRGWLADSLYISPGKAKQSAPSVDHKALSSILGHPAGERTDKEKEEVKDPVVSIPPPTVQSGGQRSDSVFSARIASVPTSPKVEQSHRHSFLIEDTEEADTSSARVFQRRDKKEEFKRIEPTLPMEELKDRYLFPFATQNKHVHPDPTKFGMGQVRRTEDTRQDHAASTKSLHTVEDESENDLEINIKDPSHLKELKEPIRTTLSEVSAMIDKFTSNFPAQQVGSRLPVEELQFTMNQVKSPNMARLIGLVAHYVYWSLFGHLNDIPLDSSHQQSLFLTIEQLFTDYETETRKRREFALFHMAYSILSMRIIIETIFKNTYPRFFTIAAEHSLAIRKIHDLLSRLFDPNSFFSRFSSLEATMEAIKVSHKSKKKEKIVSNFYTTSPIVRNLFPSPSDNRVRYLFAQQKTHHAQSLKASTKSDGLMNHGGGGGNLGIGDPQHLKAEREREKGRERMNQNDGSIFQPSDYPKSTRHDSFVSQHSRTVDHANTSNNVAHNFHNHMMNGPNGPPIKPQHEENDYIDLQNRVKLFQIALKKLQQRPHIKRYLAQKHGLKKGSEEHEDTLNLGHTQVDAATLNRDRQHKANKSVGAPSMTAPSTYALPTLSQSRRIFSSPLGGPTPRDDPVATGNFGLGLKTVKYQFTSDD
eukprot:GILK01003282.1.p1 GENE.GILK01003282.1~~GILK01003282.1.p1  ORF type:complete len:754 (+),score=98.45 GILK01003282.1:60-2264(+)